MKSTPPGDGNDRVEYIIHSPITPIMPDEPGLPPGFTPERVKKLFSTKHSRPSASDAGDGASEEGAGRGAETEPDSTQNGASPHAGQSTMDSCLLD